MRANSPRQKIIRDLVSGLGDWFNDGARLEQGRMSSDLYPYEHLFSPIQVGRLKVKNRVVMGPMGNVFMVDGSGTPGSKMIEYLVERAKGGAGLITTGLVPVNLTTDPATGESRHTTVFPRIDWRGASFSGWKAIADGCHAHDARLFAQLTAGVGRVGSPECAAKRFRLPVSASFNRNFYMPDIFCRPLTDGECRKLIWSTGQVAADAMQLGIDGVYLHGHEGYLLEQMTNPAFNRRKLGRYADWQRFGLDMVKEIRRRCGECYPVMYRIDLSLALAETYGDRMETVRSLKSFRNERTVEMTLDYMTNLVKAGVDIFDVDAGCYDNWWLPHPPNAMPPGVFLGLSRLVKEYFKAGEVQSNLGVEVPVVAVGKLGFPDLAEQALRDGACDMVMLARPLLADPEWPNKTFAGKVDEIIPCIGDQEGCLNQLLYRSHVKCTVNPRTGFEDVMGEPRPAESPKKIAVVGAGPAGVSCACHAAMRGHDVTLFERSDSVGGTLIPGSVPLIKYEVANYVAYLEAHVARSVEQHGLDARFGTEARAEDLAAGGYDAIVTATGAAPCAPPVEGIDMPHVVSAVDLLNRARLAGRTPEAGFLEDVERVVIIGGGDVGCEVACMLAREMGKRDVKVIEALAHFMERACTANRGFMIHHLELAGVELMNCTRLCRVTSAGVEVMRNVSKTVPDPYVTWKPLTPPNYHVPFAVEIELDERHVALDADLVVLATGARPDDTLYFELVKRTAAPELHNIGDSSSLGMVFGATSAGYALGTSI
ncbi:MAG: FAD-dependent oxidoreductase [Candidatus Geothermincolia bacterium]